MIITVPSFAGIIVAVAVCGIAQALSNPVTNLLITQRVAPEKKAFAVGPPLCGAMIDSRYGFSGAWALTIAVLMAGCAMTFTLAQARRR